MDSPLWVAQVACAWVRLPVVLNVGTPRSVAAAMVFTGLGHVTEKCCFGFHSVDLGFRPAASEPWGDLMCRGNRETIRG